MHYKPGADRSCRPSRRSTRLALQRRQTRRIDKVRGRSSRLPNARRPFVPARTPVGPRVLSCDRRQDAGPTPKLAPSLAGVIGDHLAMIAHAAEYEQIGDFLHDETAACERCGLRWYQNPPGGFDADIRAVEGVLVCEDCGGPYLIEAAAARGWRGDRGPDADQHEHGTHYARSGEVVG